MGERQKNEKENTINRICLALYQEPDTSEGLWRRTKIHKNTFLLRLKGLINNGLVKEHAPVTFSVRGKFFKHKFYLLEWNKTESKDIISRIFDGASLVDSNSLIAYKINSIHSSLNGIGKVELIPLHPSYTRWDLEKKIIDLDIQEKTISHEILQSYANRYEWAKHSDQLIKKRNITLATLLLACAKYYDYLVEPNQPWAYDFLISLMFDPLRSFDPPLRLFDPPLRPYVKVYEILQLLGF